MKRVQNKMWWYNTSTIQTSGSVINTVSSVSDRLVNKIVKKKKIQTSGILLHHTFGEKLFRQVLW